MKYDKSLSRRTFLRGLGGAAIALPFVDEMLTTSVFAAPPEPPRRALTLFFGLGVPKEVAAGGWGGPLEPLAKYADRLAMVRGVDLLQGQPGGGGNHFQGGGACFTARKPANDSRAGGPSIDQVIRAASYPDGVPTTIGTLLAGSFFRRGNEATRYVHSWQQDGSPVDLPIETAEALFDRIFGGGYAPVAPGDPAPTETKADRYRRSVLDAVIDDYKAVTGGASPLSDASKSRVKDHLDRIREMEKKVFPEPVEAPEEPTVSQLACAQASPPGALPLLNGQEPDPGLAGDGIDIDVDEWLTMWRKMVDVYVLGLHCDVFRFGNLTYQSGGERVRLHGDYYYDGQLYHAFDDPKTSHDYWHGYDPGKPDSTNNIMMGIHTHFIMSNLAYVLEQLDHPDYLEPNGKSLLDNAFFMVGSELGNGGKHDLESVLHMVGPSAGGVAPGIHDFDSKTDADLYSTCLAAYGIDQTMGDPGNYSGLLGGLLA